MPAALDRINRITWDEGFGCALRGCLRKGAKYAKLIWLPPSPRLRRTSGLILHFGTTEHAEYTEVNMERRLAASGFLSCVVWTGSLNYRWFGYGFDFLDFY